MSAFAKPPLWQRLRPAFAGFDGVLALADAKNRHYVELIASMSAADLLPAFIDPP